MVLAFPEHLREQAFKTIEFMRPTRIPPRFGFHVNLDGETLHLPERIYNPAVARAERFGRALPLIPYCLYTRHNDGYVRQRHLIKLLRAEEPWIVPFVLRLVGEYVVEILEVLHEHRDVLGGEQYAEFTDQNPEFVALTKQRIVSYWDLYYRERFPEFSKYPGFSVADHLGWWNDKDARRLRLA
ncbi:MAG: hypothetical protein ACI8TQ_002722 [Planctomycetota bacterium]